MYRVYSQVAGGWQLSAEIPEDQFNLNDYAGQTGIQIEYTPLGGSVTTIVLSNPGAQ